MNPILMTYISHLLNCTRYNGIKCDEIKDSSLTKLEVKRIILGYYIKYPEDF